MTMTMSIYNMTMYNNMTMSDYVCDCLYNYDFDYDCDGAMPCLGYVHGFIG